MTQDVPSVLLSLLVLSFLSVSCMHLASHARPEIKDKTVVLCHAMLNKQSPLAAVDILREESIAERHNVVKTLAGLYWLTLEDETMAPVRTRTLRILLLPFSPKCKTEIRRIVLYSNKKNDVELAMSRDIYGRTLFDLPYYRALVERKPEMAQRAKRTMGTALMTSPILYSSLFNNLEDSKYREKSNVFERYEALESALDKVVVHHYESFANEMDRYAPVRDMYLSEMNLTESDILPEPYDTCILENPNTHELYRRLKEAISDNSIAQGQCQ